MSTKIFYIRDNDEITDGPLISHVALNVIEHKHLFVQACLLAHLLVGRSVSLSRGCTVTKQLIGTGCHLGW